MKTIAGLGNPGAQYANTPHSIGFEAVDAIARAHGAEWKRSSSFNGDIAICTIGSEKVLLVKPATFMNLSGNCVAPAVKYHTGSAGDLVVGSDGSDLPVGKIRIRKGGSAGGHNGLKSVIEKMGTPDFIRLRIGVGRDPADRAEVVSHVLGKFDARLRPAIDEAVERAAEAAGTIVTQGLETAMNRFNGPTAASGKEKQ